METLNEKLWDVAHEYARLFGEIIGYEPEHWVGDCPDLCCFGDCYFFTLEEMREVVDGIDKYAKRYGSKEAVGEEVRMWTDWWLDAWSDNKELYTERVEARVTQQLRPNLNLRAWLDGCPREEIRPWSGLDADLMALNNQEKALEQLIAEYRGERSLDNVLGNVRAKIRPLEEEKKRRDHEEFERLTKKFGTI